MKRVTTVILVLAILALTSVLTACGGNEPFLEKSFDSKENKVETVLIDVQDREVTISKSEDSEIHIDYFESEKEYYEISISEEKVLLMKLVQNKKWTDFIGTKPAKEYRKVSIKLPNEVLNDVTVSTTNENIIVSPITVNGSVSLTSNGGNIEFEKMSVGKALILNAKNGNITGTIVGGYDVFSIECETKKGECNLPLSKPDGEKALKVSCNNGDIKIDFVKD